MTPEGMKRVTESLAHWQAFFGSTDRKSAAADIAMRRYMGIEDEAAPTRRRNPVRVPDAVDPTTKLRLEAAAAIAFPDGSMTVSALRRLASQGLLTIYPISGKHFTTLADIEEMTDKCHDQAKGHASTSRQPRTGGGSGSSATGSEPSALAALRATAKVLKESLPATSSASTTPKQAVAAVIQMRSK